MEASAPRCVSCLSGNRDRPLLVPRNGTLHLATARHIVKAVSKIIVLAFTAVEFIPLPVTSRVKMIVAVPAVEDVLAPTSPQHLVVASVEHFIALSAGQEVSARPAVERVLAPVGVP